MAVTEPDFLRDTRASYDAIATVYAERFRDELAAKPLDRAMLAAFAEVVRAGGAGPVADVGCGPGRVTGYLNDLGLPVFGIDLSPEMIAVARRTYPGLRFEVGSMLALDLPDAALGGVLAWYSLIHIPDERVPEAFAEFYRVLAPGGLVLLAFQVGDEVVHVAEARGAPGRARLSLAAAGVGGGVAGPGRAGGARPIAARTRRRRRLPGAGAASLPHGP